MKFALINIINDMDMDYKKTICVNPHTLELSLENTECIEDSKKCFTYKVLEPLKLKDGTKMIYNRNNMSYEISLYVPIFNKKTERYREKYLNGSERLIDIIKYPKINDVFLYCVESIETFSFAGTTDVNGTEMDSIFLSLSMYIGFTETRKGSELIQKKARNRIKDVISNDKIDIIIDNLNNNRTNKLKYRYHILDGVSYLLDFNLTDIINEEKDVSLDFSFFDKFSVNFAFDIIFYNLKGLSRNNISIIVNQEQFEMLKNFDYTEKTWQNYIKKGRFIIK